MHLIIQCGYNNISKLLSEARKNVKKVIEITMVNTYYEIGRLIVEEEQEGKERAEYGKNLIKKLSIKLSEEFGKGFSLTNLKQMKSFYIAYGKGQMVSDQFRLSFSQYIVLSRIKNIDERIIFKSKKGFKKWLYCVFISKTIFK